MILRLCLSLSMCLCAGSAAAEEKRFTLQAPAALVETGVLDYILPRFALKTGVRISLTQDDAEAAFTRESGVPVFQDADTVWHYDHMSGPHTDRFLDWLRSDIGARTVAAYQPQGEPLFSAPKDAPETAPAVVPDGDTRTGERLSLALCGRCHVVNEKNRMNAIGSTPSFAVLRTLPGWLERFEGFYVLRPHGAFTQVENVTEPFDPARPPPIVPLELTMDDLEAIMAYVATVPPADLGAPIQSQ